MAQNWLVWRTIVLSIWFEFIDPGCSTRLPVVVFCSVPLSVKPASKMCKKLCPLDPLDLASPAVTHLWQLSELMWWSDNQRRLFVPSCWVNQRRLHSAPWVLTQTRSHFLTSRQFNSYHTHDAYLCSQVINNHHLLLLVTFFLELYLRAR